jgi:hypothetical protein
MFGARDPMVAAEVAPRPLEVPYFFSSFGPIPASFASNSSALACGFAVHNFRMRSSIIGATQMRRSRAWTDIGASPPCESRILMCEVGAAWVEQALSCWTVRMASFPLMSR